MKNKFAVIVLLAAAVIMSLNTYMIYKLDRKIDDISGRMNYLDSRLSGIQNASGPANSTGQATGNVKAKKVLTPSELAEYLGISMEKVYDMVGDKEWGLPYVNIDGEYRFSKSAIDEWLKSNKDIKLSN
ncbi:MAG: helix-turn-helix domain-containing protein [Caulobacteraceae bacterium]